MFSKSKNLSLGDEIKNFQGVKVARKVIFLRFLELNFVLKTYFDCKMTKTVFSYNPGHKLLPNSNVLFDSPKATSKENVLKHK